MKYDEFPAAEAIRLFRGQKIEVQTATPAKIKGEDGVERDGFKTEMKALAAEHVLSAKKWENGKVTITTIDGERYEAGKAAEAAA